MFPIRVSTVSLLLMFLLMTGCQPSGESQAAALKGNIVKNGDFEKWTGAVPQDWIFEDKVKSKGTLSPEESKISEGKKGASLSPNATNTEPIVPLAFGQAWPAKLLKGKRLNVSANLASTGGATAEFGVFAVEKSGQISQSLILSPADSSDKLSREEGTVLIPDNNDFVIVIARCAAQGTKGTAYFDDIQITVTDAHAMEAKSKSKDSPKSVDPLKASIHVTADKDIRAIPKTIFGTNVDWSHDGKGLWDVNRQRLDPNLVRLTKELGVSLIRYPGGALSDFYHWRDGIGPQKSRKDAHHTGPKSDISKIRFGTDEALELAKLVGAELLITVNAGSGTPEEAADWVTYVKDRHTRLGTPPVTYWEVGNELYISDNNPTSPVLNISITPEKYADLFLRFAPKMREADPTIKIGAIGGQNYGKYTQSSFNDWDEKVLRAAGSQMDFFAIHNAYAPFVPDHRIVTVRQVYAAFLATPKVIRENIETVSTQIDRFVPDRADKISIGITEWGPFFHTQPESPYVDHVKTLGSALFVASTLNAFIESPKVDIGNFYKLVEPVFMGWIGKRKSEWIANAPYLALQMYTRHLGDILVKSDVESPAYDGPAVGLFDRIKNVPYLDVIASRSTDGKKLFVMAVNKHFDLPIRASIDLKGFKATGKGMARILRGTGIDAHLGATPLEVPGIKWAKQATDVENPRFAHGGPGEVSIEVEPFEATGNKFEFTFQPHSVTSLEIQ